MAEEDLITNTWNTGSFQLQRSPRCMEPTHLLCRTQLHEEELRLVKADLVILGKFFELLPSGSDREKIFDSPLFRQVVLEVLRKDFSSAGVLSFFFRRRMQTDGCPSLPARPNLVGKNESNVYLHMYVFGETFAVTKDFVFHVWSFTS